MWKAALNILLLLTFSVTTVHAIPESVKAKLEYIKADKMYNQGQYDSAIQHTINAQMLLGGKSSAQLEYMKGRSYFHAGQLSKSMAAIEAFFELSPESSSDSKMYTEMVDYYGKVNDALVAEKNEISKKEAARKFLEQQTKEAQPKLQKMLNEMVKVPEGCFEMGDGKKNLTKHKVCLDSFFIGKTEVTQSQWLAVMGTTPSYAPFKECNGDCPVERVSWEDIPKFLEMLNKKTGKEYRLPTEAEWEYACRSGGKEQKYCGGDSIDELAWYAGNSSKPQKVAQKQANGLGLYDMSGNVWEWVQDWYAPNYYKESPVKNPTGPTGETTTLGFRSFRGGSWNYDTTRSRSVYRSGHAPVLRRFDLGFRLVRSL